MIRIEKDVCKKIENWAKSNLKETHMIYFVKYSKELDVRNHKNMKGFINAEDINRVLYDNNICVMSDFECITCSIE